MESKTFNDACLGYLEIYNTLTGIEESIDRVINNILRKEVDVKANKLLESIKVPDGYKLELDDNEEWRTTITVRNEEGDILEFCYGFDSDLELIHEHISEKSVYFWIFISLGVEGNSFENLKELRTFWNDSYKQRLKKDDYVLPNMIKEKDHPYAYYLNVARNL